MIVVATTALLYVVFRIVVSLLDLLCYLFVSCKFLFFQGLHPFFVTLLTRLSLVVWIVEWFGLLFLPFFYLRAPLQKHPIVVRLRSFGPFQFIESPMPKFSLRCASRRSWFFLQLLNGGYWFKCSPWSGFGIGIGVGCMSPLMGLFVECLVIVVRLRVLWVIFWLEYDGVFQRYTLEHGF
jgi:hypothetical protein